MGRGEKVRPKKEREKAVESGEEERRSLSHRGRYNGKKKGGKTHTHAQGTQE